MAQNFEILIEYSFVLLFPKVKVKVFLSTPERHIVGIKIQTHLVVTSALDGGE